MLENAVWYVPPLPLSAPIYIVSRRIVCSTVRSIDVRASTTLTVGGALMFSNAFS